MTVSSFTLMLESAWPARLLGLAIAASLFAYLRRKDTEGQFSLYLSALAFLLVRDTVRALLPLGGLMLVSDILHYCFALFIFMYPYKASRFVLFPALILNLALASLFAADRALGFLGSLPERVVALALPVNAVLIGLAAFLRRKEGGGRQIPGMIWPYAAALLAAYGASVVVLGYASPVIERLAVPLSYAWLVMAALAALELHDRQLLSAVAYYEGSIDSLYNVLLGTGSALKGEFTTEELLKSMNEAIAAETGADGGVIFLVDEFDDLIVCKSYVGSYPPPVTLPESLPRKQNRVETYMKHIQFRLGEGIFGDVAKTGRNVFIPDVAKDPRIAINGEEDFLRISSFMAAPLMVGDKIIGLVSVIRKDPANPFEEADFDRLKLLANFGTLSVSSFFSYLEARERSGLEQSADIAADIQRSIIPKKVPQFPGLGLGAFSLPARGVSGDYFDVIQTRPDRVVCIVGDVAGKGVSAALIMVMIRAILHLVTNTNKDIATVLNWVNKGITGKIDLDHYATLAVIAADTRTGEVEYANAAHQPVLVFRRSTGAVETLDLKSLPIGVERATEYGRKALRLAPGDVVVMYTDGIVEAMNEQGKQYGRKGLSQVVEKNRDLAAKEIAAKIKGDLAAFVGSVRQHDDQTVVVLKMSQ